MLTIVLTALKTLPIKDYIYVGLIVSLTVGFGLFVRHERAIGAAAVQAADARAAQLQSVHAGEVEARATQLNTAALATFNAVVASAPAADAPAVLVCQPAPAARDPVPGDASPRGGANASPAVSADLAPVDESTVEHPVDIGPATDKLFEDTDAEITALQAYVKACQTAGICQKAN